MLDRGSALNPPRRPLRRVDLDSPDPVLVPPPPPSSSPPRFLSKMEEEDVVLAGSARMEMARTQKGDGDDDTFYARLSSAVTSLYRPPTPRDEHADARESLSSWEEEGPVGNHRGEWVELQLSAEAAATHGNIPMASNLPMEQEHSKRHNNSIWVRSTLAFEMYTEEGEAEAEISSDTKEYLECKYRILKSPVAGNNMLEKYRKAKLLSHKVQKTLNKYCGLMEKYKNVLALALTRNSRP